VRERIPSLRYSAGGLSLPLEDTPGGVQIRADRGELEALALALNSGVGDWLPGLRDAVARGETSVRDPVVVMRPVPGIDYSDAAERWRRHAGGDPGEDVFLVSSTISPAVMVPRAALLALLDRLRELREGADYFDELEGRARALDQLTAWPRTDEAIAQEHAQRRSLLTALSANGFFDAAAAEPDEQQLEDRGLATLAAYRRAALELLAYLDSPERRERLPGAAAGAVLGAPVSVDWFRHAVAPQEGLSPFAWLAWAEAQLAAAGLQPGSEGALLIREGGPWYRLRWRKDDGVTPALLSAEPA
jgi:hypothetical protein